jgi:F420H(2)-dependent biliverdin reductase
MALDPSALDENALLFLRERHLATLTTLRSNGSPHVVAVGFTFDAAHGIVRVIASAGSQKVRNIERAMAEDQAFGRAVVCQIDGPRWLSLEGTAVVTREPERIAEAVRRYSDRYQTPRENPNRVAIEITVDRILGRG